MNRKIPISACLVLILISALLTYQIVTVADQNNYNKIISEFTLHPSDDPKLDEIKSLVDEYFVHEIDKEYLSSSLAYGYVFGLDDPHATYYTSEQYLEVMSELQGNLTGIGIRVFLHYHPDSDTEEIVIFEVMEGSPAEKAGIKKGDIIYSVDKVLFSELGYTGTVNRVLGEPGTSVTLEVLRGKKVLEFTVERKIFESQLVTYKLLDADESIGYVRIYSFATSTLSQFKKAVESLKTQGAKKLIFDVRNNPGGELETITAILDYLLPEGTIITMTDKNGKKSVYTSDENEIDMPMVVLANSSTASAAELFTAALLDYNKAVFVGTTTYGKGTVQTTFQLSDGSAVKLSTQHYLPPSEISFDGVGIKPSENCEVELTEKELADFYIMSESEDRQLQKAVECLNKVN